MINLSKHIRVSRIIKKHKSLRLSTSYDSLAIKVFFLLISGYKKLKWFRSNKSCIKCDQKRKMNTGVKNIKQDKKSILYKSRPILFFHIIIYNWRRIVVVLPKKIKS